MMIDDDDGFLNFFAFRKAQTTRPLLRARAPYDDIGNFSWSVFNFLNIQKKSISALPPYTRASLYRNLPIQELLYTGASLYRSLSIQEPSYTGASLYRSLSIQDPPYTGSSLYRNLRIQEPPYSGASLYRSLPIQDPSFFF